jgi:lysylphosphatidylglycerol synthetase-like protein (DUF2156 family)
MFVPSPMSTTVFALLVTVVALICTGLTAQQSVVTVMLLIMQGLLARCFARRVVRHGWPQRTIPALLGDQSVICVACALMVLAIALTSLHLMWASPELPPARRFLRAALQWMIPAVILLSTLAQRLDEADAGSNASPQTQGQTRGQAGA